MTDLIDENPFPATDEHYAVYEQAKAADSKRLRAPCGCVSVAGSCTGMCLPAGTRDPSGHVTGGVPTSEKTVETLHGDPTDAEAYRPSSWQPVDLTEIVAGRYEAPRPTVGRRDDGVGLFYPGRMHSVTAETEAGKTWFLLIAAREELDAGNSVLYLDFEDEAAGIVPRLLAVGAKPADVLARFKYIRPDEPVRRSVLDETLTALRPTLGVIDGVTEAMALHGMELKDNTDVARFGRMLPRWIADRGPAVVLLDHVTKDAEGRGRYALGGVHKLNGINGAAYVLENRTPLVQGRTGKSTVYVAKDRPGQIRKHALPSSRGMHWLTTMELISHGEDFVETSLPAPISSDAKPRPTALMHKISEALLGATEPLSKQGIEDRVTGKAQFVRQALAALVDEGFVTVSTGPRGARLHTLVRSFGGDDE